MYGGKSYFFYRGIGQIAFLFVLPFMFFTIGVRMLLVSPYPFIAVMPYVLFSLIVYSPRLTAERALKAYRKENYAKALRKTGKACRRWFCPDSVRIFHAHLLILKKRYKSAQRVLDGLKGSGLSYADEAKICANRALIEWKRQNVQSALQLILPMKRTGADESIYYVAGKLMNCCDSPPDARKYCEEAQFYHPVHKGINRNLFCAYYLTKQYEMAKIKFRDLYYDMVPDIDTLYFMAKIRQSESRNQEGIKLLKEALKLEKASTDLVTKQHVKDLLAELEGSGSFAGEPNEI